MNDGMYTNIRNYLEEIASQNRQLLEAVHEIRLAANRIDGRMKGVTKDVPAPMAGQEDEVSAKPAVPQLAPRSEGSRVSSATPPVEGLAGFAQPPKSGQTETPKTGKKG